MKRFMAALGVALVVTALIGVVHAESESGTTLTIPAIVTTSGASIEIPVYATAEDVMSAHLVFTFDPSKFVDGIDGITIRASGWTTQNPDVEPEGVPTGEELENNIFVDYNMDSGNLMIAMSSSSWRSYNNDVICKISGVLIDDISGETLLLTWSPEDVEINGEEVTTFYSGSIEIDDVPVWDMASTGSAIVGIAMAPITVNAVDPEGRTVTYDIISGSDGWVTLENNALVGTPSDTGVTVVTVSAFDGVNTVEHVVTITIVANQKPTWQSPIEDVAAIEYHEVSIVLSAADPENQPLTYSIMDAPEWLSLNGATLAGVPHGVDIGANDVTVQVFDGVNNVEHEFTINVNLYFGDVTKNGSISALDASEILKYAVKKIDEIDLDRADVSRPELTTPLKATAHDAALILYKVVNPSYLFPVQGGNLPYGYYLTKPTFATVPALTWEHTPDGWTLNASGEDPIGADLVLRLPESAILSSDIAFDYVRDNDVVRIAAAAINSAELFHVAGTQDAPEVVSVMLNGIDAKITASSPMAFELRQNVPNPFNPSTTITFALPESAPVTLAIYDTNGRIVRTLVNGAGAAGLHEVVWNGLDDNGRAVASGVYVYRLTAGNDVSIRRLTLVR